MTQQAFIENFLANADFTNALKAVATAKLEVYSQPMQWEREAIDGIKVRAMKCHSEVDVRITSGRTNYGFVVVLGLDVKSTSIECLHGYTLADLNPQIFLDVNAIESYPSSLTSMNEAVEQQIFALFGEEADSGYIDDAESDHAELALRKAVTLKLNELLQADIMAKNYNSKLARNTHDIALSAVNQSIVALRSLACLSD